MAWTWSAPQRGTIAATMALSGSHRAVQRTVLTLGRGDAQRGLCIGFAAFLTLAGTVAPNLSAITLSSALFVAGAIVVLYATAAPASVSVHALVSLEDGAADIPAVARHASSPACLQELLQSQSGTSSADRDAFARLTAHMSHELRTPLNAILGFSEMMSNEVFGPLGSSCYAAYARDIHTSGLSLLKSAEDALAITNLLTTPDHHHRSATAHAGTASLEALAFHAPDFAARGMTVSCTVDDDADIVADPHAVRQLLINLVADAADRAQPGAHISIASRTGSNAIELLITVAGSLVEARTSDSFSMLLARTLSELSGARLVADQAGLVSSGGSDQRNEWHVAAHFTRASQNDFFA